MYVGGAFVRSESGRYFRVASADARGDADPDAVKNFITQERRAPMTESSSELSIVSERSSRFSTSTLSDQPNRRRKAKSAGVTPVGLIPVTIRLRPEIAGALKRASLERQLQGEDS